MKVLRNQTNTTRMVLRNQTNTTRRRTFMVRRYQLAAIRMVRQYHSRHPHGSPKSVSRHPHGSPISQPPSAWFAYLPNHGKPSTTFYYQNANTILNIVAKKSGAG